MSDLNFVEKLWQEHEEVVAATRQDTMKSIHAAGEKIIAALQEGNAVYTAGNGGSAADAQHFAAELVGRFESKQRQALPSVALTVDSSSLTAISNDFGYENVFARQLEALARPGDVFVGITTSGRSGNILRAMEVARSRGLVPIGLCGSDGSALAPFCDHVIAIPSSRTARIQEMHITVIHSWCGMVDAVFGV